MKQPTTKLALGRQDIVWRLAGLLDPALFDILVRPLNKPTEEYKALLDYYESDREIKLGLKKQELEQIGTVTEIVFENGMATLRGRFFEAEAGKKMLDAAKFVEFSLVELPTR